MAFEGYKLKFNLHAAHSNVGRDKDRRHFHTFTITLYLQDKNKTMDLYNDIERAVNEWLAPLQNQYLDETELFKGRETTLEAIGDRLFEVFKPRTDSINFTLIRLEIFESPIRTYSVSDKLLDSQANELVYFPSRLLEDDKDDNTDSAIGDHAEPVPEDAAESKREEDIENSEVDIKNLEENIENSEEDKPQDSDTSDSIKNGAGILESAAVLESIVIAEELHSEGGIDTEKDMKDADCTAEGEKKVSKLGVPLKLIKCLIAIIAFGAISLGIMYSIRISGNYPQGSDTLCHLYRADLLLQEIKAGNWYPLYDPMWYNGVEIMRYWAPIPLYILAFIEFVIGSSVLDAYVVFCGLVFFVGALGWLMLGWHFDRVGLSAFLAITWYFLPENMRLLILDGNLPRVIINTAMPFLLYVTWKFLEERKKSSIIGVILCTAFMGLCHIGIAFIVIACMLIFSGAYAVMCKRGKEFGQIAVSMVIGICMIGIWMVPSLQGGGASRGEDGNQVMALFFDNAFHALNPSDRYSGDLTVFYYGLSIFILCVIGILLATKRAKPGFLTGLIIFLCTTQSAYSFFVHLPFSQFLWMIRFVTVSFAFVWLSMLLWKGLRKPILIAIALFIIVDCVSSLPYIYASEYNRIEDPEEARYEQAEELLLNDAKEITNQRMAFFDLSGYGAFAPYYITGVGKGVPYVFGAGWEGAKTATNIVRLNSAIENGRYLYVFDRSLELGADTLVFPIGQLKRRERDVDALIEAGEILGYKLINQSNSSVLFHLDTPEGFGTITEYNNLAIGLAANDIALLFPDFEEGRSESLDEYSFEELSKYKKIYLSNFTYSNKSEAESKIRKLADEGVKIYIDMNRIPADKSNNSMEFMGVSAQAISFTEAFPTLFYNEKRYQMGNFIENLNQWNSVYLSGISNITGYTYMNNQELPFVGTNDNENIIFLGFNLVYHSEIASDKSAEELVSAIFAENSKKLPKRQIVPVDIFYKNSKMVLRTHMSNVNTAIAYLDIFDSDKEILEKNNCVVINEGVTTITLHYPYLISGTIVSIIGLIAMFGFCFMILRNKANQTDDNGI